MLDVRFALRVVKNPARSEEVEFVQQQLDKSQDESLMPLIRGVMVRSLSSREMIRIKMYDPQEELFIEGVLDFFDPITGSFGVDGERFNVGDIVSFG
jgi:hypothetical protein